jgi:ribonuclease-3
MSPARTRTRSAPAPDAAAPHHPERPAPDLSVLAEALGHEFRDADLLAEALLHPSVDPADRGAARHGYQRLEFLGDRVLGMAIAELLIHAFPEEPEGALARRFAGLVRADALAEIAERLDLGRHLRLSPSEEECGGRHNPATLTDACEAVIGALFLDGGWETARAFIRAHWAGMLERDLTPPQDPKTALQEWAQGRGLPLPKYAQIARAGPDHAPVFSVEVSVGDYPPETGAGPSKRQAEKLAAEKLLARLRGDTLPAPP